LLEEEILGITEGSREGRVLVEALGWKGIDGKDRKPFLVSVLAIYLDNRLIESESPWT
jgi:hypothetical protein